jgi:microcystin-dependent protein
MSEPFIAEIRIFAGNFAPRSWAFCNGQLLPIAQNTALFSLIGTTYGGDGRTTTALPNLEGRAAMHPGRGPGLTSRRLGGRGGVETVTLTEAQTPVHSHNWRTHPKPATSNDPEGRLIAESAGMNAYTDKVEGAAMNSAALSNAGGNSSHNNMQPYIALNYIIALQGLYPSRG